MVGWLVFGPDASELFDGEEVGSDPGAEASIAVVPFQVSGGAEQTWRDGMVTLLTTALDGAAGVRPLADRTILSAWEGADEERQPRVDAARERLAALTSGPDGEGG